MGRVRQIGRCNRMESPKIIHSHVWILILVLNKVTNLQENNCLRNAEGKNESFMWRNQIPISYHHVSEKANFR